MEKFIELLYKYNGIAEKKLWIITSVKQYGEEIWFDKEKEIRNYQEHITSKSYGFIKRLVDNDKIDLKELSEKELATWWNLENNILDKENTKESWIKFWTESLLMLLAISDTPIEDLISYLK